MDRTIAYLILVSLICCSCNKSNSFIWDDLENHFSKEPSDSLKRKAIQFLRRNSKDMLSENVILINYQNRDTVDRIKSGISFLDFIKRENYYPRIEHIPDSLALHEKQLIEDVELAYATWQKYPWSRQFDFEMFCNFILPYKILNEAPDNWRKDIFSKIEDTLDSLRKKQDTISVRYLWQTIMGKGLPDLKWKDNPLYLSYNSPYEEIVYRGEAQCSRFAQMYAYVLRSIGIPASIAIVPMWGHVNDGHAEVIFWDKIGKPTTLVDHPVNRAPKVFIVTFKKQSHHLDSLRRFADDFDFLLTSLVNDHLWDVTDMFTTAYDIDYSLGKKATAGIAYICAFNYGKWEPLFWGYVNKHNNTVRFNKMGVRNLYRVMIQEGERFVLGKIFSIENNGKQKFYPLNCSKKISLDIKKLNTEGHTYVEKGKIYTLQYLSNDSKWKTVLSNRCEKDSLLKFDNVPNAHFYRLLENSAKRNVSRPFQYNNGLVEWW